MSLSQISNNKIKSKEKCLSESPIDESRSSRIIGVKCTRVKGHKGEHTYHEMTESSSVIIWRWK